VRRAASPGASVLILETVMPEDRTDPRAHALDLVMLTVTGGRERTATGFNRLLRLAGFEPVAVIDTASPMRIVHAVAG
jgi:hypothetical protein